MMGVSLTAYEYDKNGNNTAKVCGGERLEYVYDAFGKLKRYITNDSTARYAYNSGGIRTLKWVDGVETKYIINGADVVGEVSDGETTTYLRGINLICTDEYYYVFDAHGDVVNLTDDDGSVVKTYDYDAFGVEKNRDDSDTNPFRYCGEYWDSETETYYLRARYYDPNLGRFTSQDSVLSISREMPNGQKIADPLSLNLYTYCAGNPIAYTDRSGHFWETVFDVASTVWDIVDLIKKPSWKTALSLLWDVGATIIPFIPGSYVEKGGKLLLKAVGKADDAVDLLKIDDAVRAIRALDKSEILALAGNGKMIAPFRFLKKIAKGLGQEVHHLIEKRFAKSLGIKDADGILSVMIDHDTHVSITKLMRREIGYLNYIMDLITTNATPQEIWDATVKVYEELNMTEYLPVLKDYLLEFSSKVDKITDWKGY